MLDICNRTGFHEISPWLVIILTTSVNGETFGHAVAVKSFERYEKYLRLKTDSLSDTDETLVECQILGKKIQFLHLPQF